MAFKALDGIDVHEELEVLHWHQLNNARGMLFPNAPPFPKESSRALTARDLVSVDLDNVPSEDTDDTESTIFTRYLSRRVSSFALADSGAARAMNSDLSSMSSSTWRVMPTPIYNSSPTKCSFSFSAATSSFAVSSREAHPHPHPQ